MKRLLRERNTAEMLDAFQDKLDELNSCDQVSASDEFDDEESEDTYYMLVDRKDVVDSDGFWTKYSMYRKMPGNEYVMIYGDPDLYQPEDGDFDMEFDNEAEAFEWFESYQGFEDDEDD